ncbi:MAG: N-acetylmuramoyl-L-alanine amidase [Nannocystaceae bacterium]|nr:N-acetylmuramoyl-L-alanine amidase [Nannocystaceae bacterium]
MPGLASIPSLVAALLAARVSAGSPTPTTGPRPLLEQPYTVVLDAGHGGSNSGCANAHGDVHEKDVTLALAIEVREILRERLPHAEIVLTRDDDRTLALADRVTRANEGGADVFVSLHANASPRHDQSGFETYVLDAQASSVDAALTARRENGSPGSAPGSGGAVPQAQSMVEQLRASAHRNAALALAGAIQREQATRFPGRSDRGVRQAAFDVLLGIKMPAVLFEAAFLDHGRDAAVLLDAEQRRSIAAGVAEALIEHYRRSQRGRTIAVPARCSAASGC